MSKTETELFFTVWDENRQYVFASIVESLEEANKLAEEWIENERADRVSMQWRRKKSRTNTGFNRAASSNE